MEKQPQRLLAAAGARVDCMVWNESDGLPGSECSGAAQPSAWETSAGELLFPTLQGVALVQPLLAADRAPDIPVLIEAVLADSRALDSSRPVDLVRPVEMLEFHFTYSCLSAPEKVVFRYRLRGFDDQWTQTMPDRERTALYLNLDPGRYVFEVQARGGAGFWSPAPATYSLRIRSPFPWPWFLPLLLVPVGYLVRRSVRGGRRPPVRPKYQTSGLTADVAESKLKDLLTLMEREKPYLEANLTLGALAKRLGIHQNYLSRIINEYRQQSFNDFVNQYRIAEVRHRLTSPEWKSRSILQIAYETGFYSKSVFNTAFKKFTGQTPSQYRQGSQAD
jgi:AraC-like DNA-binding protein